VGGGGGGGGTGGAGVGGGGGGGGGGDGPRIFGSRHPGMLSCAVKIRDLFERSGRLLERKAGLLSKISVAVLSVSNTSVPPSYKRAGV